MRRLLALLAALLLLFGAAACSSDSDDKADDDTSESTEEATTDDEEEAGDDEEAGDGSEADYVEALMANLLEDGDSPITEDEGECIAEGVVEEIGVDTLQEEGVTPEAFAEDGPGALGGTMSDDQADAMADIFLGCLESPGAFFAAAFGATDDESVACIEDNLDEDDLRAFIAQAMLAEEGEDMPDEMMTIFTDLAEACPEIMAGANG